MTTTATLPQEKTNELENKHSGFAFTRMLIDYGVEYIFGIPGGQTLPLYDAAYAYQDRIKHILFRDERSAGHAACAYSRIAGKLGVCDATVGAGAANLPSALAEALNSSTPMLAIVGEHPVTWVNRSEYGRASQGMDQISMLKAVCKKVIYVPTQENLPELVKTAFQEATTGRPGPVSLVIPADVFRKQGSPSNIDRFIDPSLNQYLSRRSAPDPSDVVRAASLLRKAKRPVMLLGGGALISEAMSEAQELAELLSMPVAHTITGKGTLSDDHDLNMGVVGIFANTPSAEAAIREADVVFLVGNKSSQSSSFMWTVPKAEQTVIQLDIDPAEVGRIFRTDVGLIGDAKLGLQALIDALKNIDFPSIDIEWLQQLRNLRERWQAKKSKLFASEDKPIKPYRVMKALNDIMGKEDILVCDAGFATGWGAIYYSQQVPGRHSIYPRGLAGLGYAVAASIGAQLAAPNRRVVSLAGDGGFTYGMPELSTQALVGLPIVNVVLNNYVFGWVKWAEKAWYNGSFKASELQAIDFAKVAEGMGCVGLKVEDPGDLESTLEHAFKLNKPVVVEVITDADSTPNVKDD